MWERAPAREGFGYNLRSLGTPATPCNAENLN